MMVVTSACGRPDNQQNHITPLIFLIMSFVSLLLATALVLDLMILPITQTISLPRRYPASSSDWPGA